MTKIEQTRRAMYDALAKLKTNPRSKVVMGSFECAMEEHLEELRAPKDQKPGCSQQAAVIAALRLDLKCIVEERDGLQARMRVIDADYEKSQKALVIAGDELRAAQTNARHWREECGKLDSTLRAFQSGDVYKQYLHDRKDLQSAEAMTDSLHEKLADAHAVIGQQEQLIAGQRKAIADMHSELTHRRVICRAFEDARNAFVALDIALHDSPQSNAMRAINRDLVDPELPF